MVIQTEGEGRVGVSYGYPKNFVAPWSRQGLRIGWALIQGAERCIGFGDRLPAAHAAPDGNAWRARWSRCAHFSGINSCTGRPRR
jgi:hypothetical protein